MWWPNAFAMPYGLRGWNCVSSFCGVSRTWPYIADEDAWKKRICRPVADCEPHAPETTRIASRIRNTPTPVTWAVISGCRQDSGTHEIAQVVHLIRLAVLDRRDQAVLIEEVA